MANANYLILDDYGAGAGPSGGQTGGTSGEVLWGPFSSPSVQAAAQVAYLISSIGQRPVRLAALNQAPPYTLIAGLGANTALTSVPSGIGY